MCGLSDHPPLPFSLQMLQAGWPWLIVLMLFVALFVAIYVTGLRTAARTGDQSLHSRGIRFRLLAMLCICLIAMGFGMWWFAYHLMLSDWLGRQTTVLIIEQRLGSNCAISDAFVHRVEAATDRATQQEFYLFLLTLLSFLVCSAYALWIAISELVRKRRAHSTS